MDETEIKKLEENIDATKIRNILASSIDPFGKWMPKEFLLNQLFLTYALSVYEQAEHHTQLPKFRILFFLLQRVSVTGETKALWQKAAIWFNAMHSHVFDKIPADYKKGDQVKKTEEGDYPSFDDNDKAFKVKCGFSEYVLARYFMANANVLLEKFKIPSADAKAFFSSLCTEGKKNSKPLALPHEEDGVQEMLNSVINKQEEEQIEQLKRCLIDLPLLKNHEENTSFLNDEVNRGIESYIKKSRLLFFAPAHFEEANKTLKFFNENKNLKAKLNELFRLRKYLKEQNSNELLSVVNKIFLQVYHALAKPSFTLTSKPF